MRVDIRCVYPFALTSNRVLPRERELGENLKINAGRVCTEIIALGIFLAPRDDTSLWGSLSFLKKTTWEPMILASSGIADLPMRMKALFSTHDFRSLANAVTHSSGDSGDFLNSEWASSLSCVNAVGTRSDVVLGWSLEVHEGMFVSG